MRQKQKAVGRFVGLLLILFGFSVWGQTQPLTVTSYSDAVRFAAQGAVKELRVEVLSLAGQRVFDSGVVSSAALDWKMLNIQGQPVASGVYIYTVTVKDAFGNVTKKLGKLALVRGKAGQVAPPISGVTIGQLSDHRVLLQPQTVVSGSSLAINGTGSFGLSPGTHGILLLYMHSQTNWAEGVQVRKRGNTGDINGAVLSGAELGYNSFWGWDGTAYGRGAYFIARAAENWTSTGHGADFGIATTAVGSTTNAIRLWVLANGNVGIGTTSPGERLTVAGVVHSTSGGFRFPDGTIQTTAATGAIGGWTDDGAIVRLTTAGDNVGIGTATTSAKTHISNTANQPGLRVDSSDGTNAIEVRNTAVSPASMVFRVERVTGNVFAAGSITGGGADVAERIDTTEPLEAGDVVEIDPENPGKFRKAREGLSHRVAGVISTAPGVVLGNEKQLDGGIDARPILALAGRVPVKVTAKYGTISIGDLLVSSPIPGYAMKCPEASKCIGAVIGKALEPLKEGVGKIEAQVMLR
jgi:hypothetical protein